MKKPTKQNQTLKGLFYPVVNLFVFILFVFSAQAQTINDALKLTENEQYDAATDIYKKLIVANPGNSDFYYYLGENYLLSDNPDSALIKYKEGLKINPANALLKIGMAKYDLNKYSIAEMKRMSELDPKEKANYEEAQQLVNQAKSLLDEAISASGGKNAQVFIEAADALIHFKNTDYDKAKVYLDKAFALQPKNFEILILYGDLYAAENNGSLSADYYNKALDLNPSSPRSIVNKGRLYKRSTNYQGASEEFKRAISIDDNFAPAHRELGEAYYRLNKLDLAKAEYKKYLDLSKNNCGARVQYAYFLYISKDFSNAINEINQMKNCDPNNLRALRIKAYSAYEMKDSVRSLEAMKDLFSRIKEDKIVAVDYEYYGKSLIANGQDSLGAYNLRKAYQMDNTRCDLLTEMYKSYDRMKKYAEAAAVLNEKIQNCKGATVTDYFNLGRSFLFSGDYVKADSAFAKVTDKLPGYASGWLYRGKVNELLDSTKEKKGLAKPFYEKYIDAVNADTSANKMAKYKDGLIAAYRYMAIYSFTIEKNTPKTKELYKKILDLDPDDQNAKDAVRGIEFEQEQKNKKKP